MRSSMLEVLRQEYVTTARAKGLAPQLVVLRHALKNALIPAVTMLGLQLGALLGGAVVTETIFSRPGIGRLAVEAILSRDFPLVQGTVLFAASDLRPGQPAGRLSYAVHRSADPLPMSAPALASAAADVGAASCAARPRPASVRRARAGTRLLRSRSALVGGTVLLLIVLAALRRR